MVFDANQRGRFVAGAVCPACKELDRVMIKKEKGLSFTYCVGCGYTKAQPSDNQQPTPHLKGRLEKPPKIDMKASVVKIVEIKKDC